MSKFDKEEPSTFEIFKRFDDKTKTPSASKIESMPDPRGDTDIEKAFKKMLKMIPGNSEKILSEELCEQIDSVKKMVASNEKDEESVLEAIQECLDGLTFQLSERRKAS